MSAPEAPMAEEGIPPEAPPEAAAEKLSALTNAEALARYHQMRENMEDPHRQGVAHAYLHGATTGSIGAGLGRLVGGDRGAAAGMAIGTAGGAYHGWGKGKQVAADAQELRAAEAAGNTQGLSRGARGLKSQLALNQDETYQGRQGAIGGGTMGAVLGSAGGTGLGYLASKSPGGAIAGGALGAAGGGILGALGGRALGKSQARTMKQIMDAGRQEEMANKVSAFSDAKQEKGLGKALVGLAKKKMDPDQKAGLAKGLTKAIKKEHAEGDPVKLSSDFDRASAIQSLHDDAERNASSFAKRHGIPHKANDPSNIKKRNAVFATYSDKGLQKRLGHLPANRAHEKNSGYKLSFRLPSAVQTENAGRKGLEAVKAGLKGRKSPVSIASLGGVEAVKAGLRGKKAPVSIASIRQALGH